MIRKSPPVCLAISIIRLILRKLRFSKQYIDNTIKTENGSEFTVFRHITAYPDNECETTSVFIVSFKFSQLSHRANKFISNLPMLLISGFPGFMTKIYSVNNANGYWQGMYQWESKQALEDYKKSFVYRIMNKRAIKDTISTMEFHSHNLNYYIEKFKM
ncbi:hypothetical protein ACFLSQ_05525 [Bacteroidota bacterium]